MPTGKLKGFQGTIIYIYIYIYIINTGAVQPAPCVQGEASAPSAGQRAKTKASRFSGTGIAQLFLRSATLFLSLACMSSCLCCGLPCISSSCALQP